MGRKKTHFGHYIMQMLCATMSEVMQMDREVFIQRLRQLRADWRLSQAALAEALGISRSCLKNWKLGDSTPTMEMLADIALLFRVSVDYLLGLDERTCIQTNFLSDRAVSAITDLIRTIEEEKQEQEKKSRIKQ